MRRSIRCIAAMLSLCFVTTATAFGEDSPRAKWVAPAKAAQKQNPIPATPASVKAGSKLFTNNCVSCHGAAGKGDGLLAASLPIKPANLRSAEIWWQTDGAIFWKISTGRQPMPTWEPILEESERWNVVNFLRSTFSPLPAFSVAQPIRVAMLTDPPAPTPDPPTPATEPASPAPVTREDYDAIVRRLLQEQKQMRAEIEQLKRQRAPAAAGVASPALQPGGVAPGGGLASADDLDEVQKQVAAIKKDLDRARPGTGGFLLVGDGSITYSAQHGGTSTFSAAASPLILFKPTDRLLFETAFDLNLNTNQDTSSSTSIDLTIANASYSLTDWLTVGGGLFVTPFGVYHNHFDPPWINKFADDPLPLGDRAIAPGSSLGLYARGAQLIGNSKIVYDAYVINGPNLVTADKTAAGTLAFDNFSDLNNDKSVGGRLGFIPIPNLELGYSVMAGQANPAGGSPSTHFLLQGVDLNYRPDVPALGGTFDFRTEWIWSNVERVTYDPNGSLGFGPLNFSNYRDGGYVQLCFRPTHESNEIIRNIELCGRWEYLKIPEAAPGGGTEQRYTIGVDYWLNPQAVLKFDYEFDRRSRSLGPQQSGLLIQLGLGF